MGSSPTSHVNDILQTLEALLRHPKGSLHEDGICGPRLGQHITHACIEIYGDCMYIEVESGVTVVAKGSTLCGADSREKRDTPLIASMHLPCRTNVSLPESQADLKPKQ